jgi:hypothetical protein
MSINQRQLNQESRTLSQVESDAMERKGAISANLTNQIAIVADLLISLSSGYNSLVSVMHYRRCQYDVDQQRYLNMCTSQHRSMRTKHS